MLDNLLGSRLEAETMGIPGRSGIAALILTLLFLGEGICQPFF